MKSRNDALVSLHASVEAKRNELASRNEMLMREHLILTEAFQQNVEQNEEFKTSIVGLEKIEKPIFVTCVPVAVTLLFDS